MTPERHIRPLLAVGDLARGQMVITSARWIFVLAGLFLILLDPDPNPLRFRLHILILLLLAVFNFYLFTQALMRRPALQIVIYAASFADLAVISFVALAQNGFSSHIYVFYFPALLAISVAFPPPMLFLFTATMVFAYGIIGATTHDLPLYELPTLLVRLIVMTAVAFCGSRFRQIEEARRQPTKAANNPEPSVAEFEMAMAGD